MKIAIISDIHGNTFALDAVLKDIKSENCDKIFCLGDLAMAGGEPNKTIDTIKKLKDDEKIVVIQGNTDEMLGNVDKMPKSVMEDNSSPMLNALKDDIKLLTEEQINFLKTLDKQKELEINGVKILLVHGSPRKNNEDISPNLPLEKVEEIIASTKCDIILCGHTHLPCGYQTNTKQTVVNVGSIGRPLTQNPKSCYAILEIQEDGTFEVLHKFVDYDKESAYEILKNRNYKGAESIANLLLNPTSRHG